uniref:ACE1 transcription factor n=1 Tax=Phanerodontia chrysosporium TaxID=2822231 RepID=Q1G0Y1_PHACH|nr:ACE1 transcription factor [Phanerodontia chrysosporium]
MVLVGEKKYACETCIKGHRSSNCKHVDRPLYEIKKKGRPVTQCDHCRELRKTKQVHVKCVCEVKPPESGADAPSSSASTSSKKGNKKVPASAAFPSGLPEALGASVASKPLSDGSDSEQEMHTSTCTCKTTGICNCATPRATANRSKKGGKSQALPEDYTPAPLMAQPAALVASANSGRNRPVLPRPTHPLHSRSSPPRSVQNPTGAHHQRSQGHFSPYERAYEYAHGSDVGPSLEMPYPRSAPAQYSAQRGADLRAMNPDLGVPRDNNTDDFTAFMNSWLSNVQPALPPTDLPAATCDCGPNCACPGCVIHRGPSAIPPGFESCVSPSTCTACTNCNMLPAFDNGPQFEDWFQRMNAVPSTAGTSDSLLPSSASSPPPFTTSPEQHSPQPQHFDPTMWQSYALWPNLQNQMPGPPPPEDGVSTCCAGQCKCPHRVCACPADCCGCCSGCTCPSCNHQDRSMGLGSGKTLTFAVSGERGPCCGGGRDTTPDYSQQIRAPIAGPSRSQNEVTLGSGRPLDLRGVFEEWGTPGSAATDIPRVSLSRASSSSSHSSSHRSHRSSSQSLVPSPSARTPDGGVGACCTSMQTLSTSRAGSHASGSNNNSPVPPSYTPSHVKSFPSSPFDIDDGSPRIF